MRGIRQTINYVRYACTNTTIVLIAVFLTAFGAAAIGIHQNTNESNVNAASCSDNDIVRCGVNNYGDITRAYDSNAHGDVRGIYDHYWIKRTLPAGAHVYDGWARPDGTVTANGRVVAKNAASIGRQPIKYSHPISINGKTYYQTSHVNGQAFANPNASLPTLVVLDANGNFMYAVIKACGNPIYATPVNPPAPQPKDIQVCDLASRKVITIKENQYDSSKHSKNLEDCKPKNIQVCELATKKVVTITEDKFDETKYSKNLEDCKEKPVITVEVCDTELKKIVTVSEETAKEDRYSTNLEDCTEKCPLPGKEDVAKDSDECAPCEYNTTIPADSPECKAPTPKPTPKPTPTPVPAPAELPTTGIEDTFGTILGLTSMSLAIYYYALSRRQ